MIQVNGLWTPTGFHGELALDDGADVGKTIKRAIRKIQVQYEDIKYCLLPRQDGSTLIYFELID